MFPISICFVPATNSLQTVYEQNLAEGQWTTIDGNPAVVVDTPGCVQEESRMYNEEREFLLEKGKELAQALVR